MGKNKGSHDKNMPLFENSEKFAGKESYNSSIKDNVLSFDNALRCRSTFGQTQSEKKAIESILERAKKIDW